MVCFRVTTFISTGLSEDVVGLLGLTRVGVIFVGSPRFKFLRSTLAYAGGHGQQGCGGVCVLYTTTFTGPSYDFLHYQCFTSIFGNFYNGVDHRDGYTFRVGSPPWVLFRGGVGGRLLFSLG